VELIGLYLIATGLLVVAGVAKAIRPDDTARALNALVSAWARPAMTQRRMRMAIRGGAVMEAALGVVAIAFPRQVTAGLVATSYALFAGVVLYARSRGGALSSCGCFGRADTPATALHALVDLVLAGACVAVAASAPSSGSLVTLLGRQPAAGVPLLFVSAVGLYMAYLALAVLPPLVGARQLVRRPTAGGTMS
jgi:hypothetical protein